MMWKKFPTLGQVEQCRLETGIFLISGVYIATCCDVQMDTDSRWKHNDMVLSGSPV